MFSINQVSGHLNQYDIKDGNGNRHFISYSSHIATIDGWTRVAKVDPEYCFYSRTTSKHFKEWAPVDLFEAVKKAHKAIGTKKEWDTARQLANGFEFVSLNK